MLETGTITVSFGTYEIWIYTEQTPFLVLVDAVPTGQQVCGSGPDSVSTTIGDHGFTISANIQSNSADIDWIAE